MVWVIVKVIGVVYSVGFFLIFINGLLLSVGRNFRFLD